MQALRRALGLGLALSLVGPGVALAQDEERIDTDPEVAAHVENGPADLEGLLEGLTEEEQKLVVERGLEPAGEIEGGSWEGEPDGPAFGFPPGSKTAVFECFRKSVAGNRVWTYRSTWHWSWNGSVVTAAKHHENLINLAAGWASGSPESVYLNGWGTVGKSWDVGRYTQGKVIWQPFGQFIQEDRPILGAAVHGNGTVWDSTHTKLCKS